MDRRYQRWLDLQYQDLQHSAVLRKADVGRG